MMRFARMSFVAAAAGAQVIQDKLGNPVHETTGLLKKVAAATGS